MLATLQSTLKLVAASGALKTKNHLLCGLCLLVEHGLSLTTETLLLAIVTTLTYLTPKKTHKNDVQHTAVKRKKETNPER